MISSNGPTIEPDALRKNVSGIDLGSMPASLTCETKLVICATTRHGEVTGETSVRLSIGTPSDPDAAATSMVARSASRSRVVAAALSILVAPDSVATHQPAAGGRIE